MKTIALLYDSVLDVGGVENHILALLRNRDATQFSFIVFSAVSKTFEEKINRLNIPVIQLHRRHPLNPATPILVSRLLKDNHIDLIHAHSPTSAMWGRLAGRMTSTPSIVTVHLPVEKYHGDLDTFRARLGRKIYQSIDRWFNWNPKFTRFLIFVSQTGFDHAIRHQLAPDEYSVVIPIGINMEPYVAENRQKARHRFGVVDDTKIIVFVGRLDWQKGLDIMLHAVSQLRIVNSRFKVWIIGDGPLRSTLEAQIDQTGLSKIVQLWGNQDDIASFLFASDIFVLPSRYEAMPSSILEAMAAGLPCIVTKVGDNDRVIGDGIGGIVIPPEDIDQLVRALHTLLTDAALRRQMSKAARERSKDYDEKTMVKQIEHVYQFVLG